MRKQIAQESAEPYIDGRYWLPGCFKWDEKSIPVVDTPLANQPQIVGRATDLRREGDGKITAEIEWLDGVDPDLSVTVTIRKIKEADGYPEGVIALESGTIVEIFVTEAVPWSKTWTEQNIVRNDA